MGEYVSTFENASHDDLTTVGCRDALLPAILADSFNFRALLEVPAHITTNLLEDYSLHRAESSGETHQRGPKSVHRDQKTS